MHHLNKNFHSEKSDQASLREFFFFSFKIHVSEEYHTSLRLKLNMKHAVMRHISIKRSVDKRGQCAKTLIRISSPNSPKHLIAVEITLLTSPSLVMICQHAAVRVC